MFKVLPCQHIVEGYEYKQAFSQHIIQLLEEKGYKLCHEGCAWDDDEIRNYCAFDEWVLEEAVAMAENRTNEYGTIIWHITDDKVMHFYKAINCEEPTNKEISL